MTKKEKEITKAVSQLEKAYEKKLAFEYKRAYAEIQTALLKFADKYAVDGKLSRTETYKRGRFEKLQAQIKAELAKLPGQTATTNYLYDQYKLNYFGAGYILENDYQVKLAYSNISKEKIKAALTTPLQKISIANNRNTVIRKIQSSLVQSVAQGEGVGILKKRIITDLENNANNALRIARTESTRVSGEAQIDSYKHAAKKGLPIKKQWIATLDGVTRDRHADIDGEIRDIDEPFSNGLMQPGDDAGPPEEVINCRCTMRTIIEGIDSAQEFRRARGTDGNNEIIKYKTFREWEKERVT